MYLSKKNVIFNFIFIFLIACFISYVGLTKTFDLSFQVSSVGGLLLGYSILMPMRLYAKNSKYKDEN
ncbi:MULTISPECIES: hypothetical protein [Mammaliicoccus]|uniref:Uncharacterized protein n=1 Tax=Mammaliicoccus vitulinus TaxID=71237 RepID=A0A2T4PQB5_9STAP|nr:MULTISPECIES: hypothetical protein [Mammaliicoccus]MBO3076929.1 hypothetical protein [Mammaliicoccus vitulinus]PTI27755.1 hypothetical protein BU072_12880 [Mammaliicoccus vitulinus]PTI35117.1 hypothetical protein BU074_12845 [Mammaliicoccus vitulinus]PTI69157.1 hypothetical protein BU073_12390 [Mammaliicoccus vitulinus]QQY18639.1 hypothetical protein I6J11_08045 [Mammaliicoccus vitulinus]